MSTKPLTIGHLARSVGVNVETIRYYQRVGLIKEPTKPADGYRHYNAEVIDRIRFIKRAQRLGFRLEEIGELLALGDGHCSDVKVRAERKRTQIDAQIRDLQALRATLSNLITQCAITGDAAAPCPIIQALAHETDPYEELPSQ